ncbi:M48 family metalloprotease [Pseudooctadecabacter jejudonensis]|uniref:TPR repeat-containing protein YfgC n=1 Tax=Pseudooctadecabacter jejudonensis TaxID=1391910 RepID=A0A1Y5R9K5_9RHOB|nr:M48 family metalloprotease [Pseudooctadecabacter jejudonensis]SLN11955.1 TPR repeat-containing protein YfgC precursor [Pseudooctadecabacter jejudonensis]
MRHSILAVLISLWLGLIGLASPAQAVSLIRDADIENSLDQLAAPILRAAGLNPNRVRILVVDDSSLNAFVLGNNAIFIHAGLLQRLGAADEVQAVIAHEAAHIANGHLSRRLSNLRGSRSAAGFGIALALAVALASDNPQAAGGVAAGAAGAAQRQFFAHTRAEEAAADQSSIRYMLRAGVDPAAATRVLDVFRGQEALSVSRQDPYTRTHPLTTDRIRALRGLVAANPGTPRDTTAADFWFARAQGKLSAFRQNPGWTLRRVRGDDSPIGLMRRAVAHHRQANANEAIRAMQTLLAQYPNDAYWHELFGQILLESRQPGPAVTSYRNAVSLNNDEPLILGGYGRALLALDSAQGNAEAVRVLERARALDGQSASILRDLGQAYARSGRPGLASLATAERYALTGRVRDAVVHAQRAADRLPRGSASWQRAQDVLSAAQ